MLIAKSASWGPLLTYWVWISREHGVFNKVPKSCSCAPQFENHQPALSGTQEQRHHHPLPLSLRILQFLPRVPDSTAFNTQAHHICIQTHLHFALTHFLVNLHVSYHWPFLNACRYTQALHALLCLHVFVPAIYSLYLNCSISQNIIAANI